MSETCCGKRLTSYHKIYPAFGAGLSPRPWAGECWEEGYRCKKCGRLRIPVGPPVDGSAYRADVLRIRTQLAAEGEIAVSEI